MTDFFVKDNGIIVLDTEVINRFAGHAALDFFGIVGMGSSIVKDGVEKMFKGDNVSRGVIARKMKRDSSSIFILNYWLFG